MIAWVCFALLGLVWTCLGLSEKKCGRDIWKINLDDKCAREVRQINSEETSEET